MAHCIIVDIPPIDPPIDILGLTVQIGGTHDGQPVGVQVGLDQEGGLLGQLLGGLLCGPDGTLDPGGLADLADLLDGLAALLRLLGNR